MIKTKKAVICALSALLVAFSAGVAGAQTDYPSRPIHFIVGFAAGAQVYLLKPVDWVIAWPKIEPFLRD